MHRKYYCPPHPHIQHRCHPWPTSWPLHLPGGDEGEGGDAGGRPQVAQAPHVQVQYRYCMVQYGTLVQVAQALHVQDRLCPLRPPLRGGGLHRLSCLVDQR